MGTGRPAPDEVWPPPRSGRQWTVDRRARLAREIAPAAPNIISASVDGSGTVVSGAEATNVPERKSSVLSSTNQSENELVTSERNAVFAGRAVESNIVVGPRRRPTKIGLFSRPGKTGSAAKNASPSHGTPSPSTSALSATDTPLPKPSPTMGSV